MKTRRLIQHVVGQIALVTFTLCMAIPAELRGEESAQTRIFFASNCRR